MLKLERKSLEFLLKHYCGVAADKQCVTIQSRLTFVLLHFHLLTLRSISILLIGCRYQNADWRIRPLPDVMTRLVYSLSSLSRYCFASVELS